MKIIKGLMQPIISIFAVMALVYYVKMESIGGGYAVVLSALIGALAGFMLALKFIDYCVTYQPEIIVQTYEKWRQDGRRDKLVASVNSRRSSSKR